MQDRVSGSVIGPSAIFPRGYLWLAPAWYAIVTATLLALPWPPLWFRLSAAAGLAMAAVTFVIAASQMRVRGFWADDAGVRFGLPPDTRRPRRYRRTAQGLTWHDIDQVFLIERADGVLLEFRLNPAARHKVRPARPTRSALARELAPLLIWPPGYSRRPTGLTTAVDDPPRYLVPLYDYSVDDLRHVFRALAPPRVTVAVQGRGW